VVHRGERSPGIADLHASLAQHLEGLGARDLVDEMETDKELRLTVGKVPDRMGIPDFLK
jgi:hypothetical protein